MARSEVSIMYCIYNYFLTQIEEDSESELTTRKSTSEFEVLSESSSVEQVPCGENESTKVEDDPIPPESALLKPEDDSIPLKPESTHQKPMNGSILPEFAFQKSPVDDFISPEPVSIHEKSMNNISSELSLAPGSISPKRPVSAPTTPPRLVPTLSKPESKHPKLASTSSEPSDMEEEPSVFHQSAAPTTGKV